MSHATAYIGPFFSTENKTNNDAMHTSSLGVRCSKTQRLEKEPRVKEKER